MKTYPLISAIILPMSSVVPRISSWIIRPCERNWAPLRLFCFPRAGGGAAAFRGWPENCHPDIEVCLIQPPGRENRLREEPVTSMASLVSAVASEITELLDRPCAFYGHSLGAKVAFETARELRRRGLPQPIHIFAAASSGPAVSWSHPWLHSLDDADLLREVQRRYGGVPSEVLEDQELCALLTPALRADLTIVETYQYCEESPLVTPITCFCGTADWMTPESEASDWRRQTSGPFQLHTFPGDHFFPVQARSSILNLIAQELQLGSVQSQLAAHRS